jgi:hypothetical protein
MNSAGVEVYRGKPEFPDDLRPVKLDAGSAFQFSDCRPGKTTHSFSGGLPAGSGKAAA